MVYAPLKHSIYRAVWIAVFFSNIGTWIHTVTSSLLMTKLTSSPTVIALVQTSSMLPLLLFSIPAGILADLYDRKSIVIKAQIIMSVFAFLMALVTYLGGMSDILLLIMTFLLNIGLAFNQPAWQALASTLIPPNDIKQAAALNNLSFNLSRCIGPAIAGFYFSKLGPAFLFLLNGISFLAVIAVLNVKINHSAEVKERINFNSMLQGFKEAFGFFTQFPNLKFIFTKSFLYFTVASCLWAILPYIVIVYYHMQDKELGVLMSAAGIGAISNASSIFYLRKFLKDNQLTTLSFFLAGLAILIFAKSSYFPLLFITMLIFGFSWSLSVSVFNGMLQAEFPKHTRSRLIGIYCVIFAFAQAFGSFISGKSIQLIGLDKTVFNIALITLCSACCYLLFSSHGNLSKIIYIRNQ